ncbi:MAG: glycosyltransferase [Acidobacteria bacterium]|jgi:glycosyltransferase involved in cell wall biosynthesis|nr:MAG: glycosyltransferase [Acidobacteriota bacterium]GIU82238.1 MAG: glycosyl transferase [Pyrinomonadaceae bacterium]
MKKNKTLYICYFGLREPLVQTQVIPYLREIAKGGVKPYLLTFEPDLRSWSKEKIEDSRRKLASEGIEWHFLKYHKRPSVPATAFDILCGTWFIWRKNRKEKFDVLHARVHVPMLMAVLARILSLHKPKILFDIRGFFPEEYVDSGVWKANGWLYRSAKIIEKWLLREANGFVVLTEKARSILFPESKETGLDKFNRPVEVIPCCVDAARFQNLNHHNQSEKVNGKPVFIYVGSFGSWYLTDKMIEFLSFAHRQYPEAFTIILTQRDVEKAKAQLTKAGLNPDSFIVRSVAPEEIPEYASKASVAISFIKTCYSKQASSPTKFAEYLYCGLPVVSNSGVGDLDELIEKEKVGVILREFTQDGYSKALEEIIALSKDETCRERCRRVAREYFDLERIGGERYRRIYRRLLQ